MSAEHDEEFVVFVSENSTRLLTAAWMLTGDPYTAEKLVQEAFERVYVRWGRVRRKQPSAYARKTVLKVHTDRWRKSAKEVAPDTTPQRGGERASRHVDVIRALQALSAREREVVVLRHYLDQSEQATGDALNIGRGTVNASGARGLSEMCSLLGGGRSYAPSENDVLGLINQAAMDPPSMSLAPQSVLVSAQNRGRKHGRARGGMALAAFAAAGAIWLGTSSGPEDDATRDDDAAAPTQTKAVVPAVPKVWDDSVAFQEVLPQDDTQPLGFRRASLVHTPKDGFTVELSKEQGKASIEAAEGELLDGVTLFTHDGDSLIVTEPLFDGIPYLDLDETVDFMSYGGEYLDRDTDSPFVWLVEGEVEPAAIRDIFWSLPDQVVASSGTPVINESVTVGADTIDIMVVPETDQWAQRAKDGIYGLFTVGDFIGAAWEGDLTVAVLPADLSNPVLTTSSDLYDDEDLMSDERMSVPMSSRPVDDYQVVWGTVGQGELIDGDLPMVSWDGNDAATVEWPEAELSETPEGVEVRVVGAESALTIVSGQETAQAVLGTDGSALVVAPVPEALAAEADRFGGESEYGQIVVDTGGRLQLGWDLAQGGGWDVVELPKSPSLAGAMLGAGSVTDPTAKVLPTLLFEEELGPQWSGSNQQADVEVNGKTINVAIEPNLKVWAAGCNSGNPGVGSVGSTQISLVWCTDGPDAQEPQLEGFGVLVVPTADASSVEVVARESGQELVEAMDDPVVADIGDGLSMWVLPLGRDDGGSGRGPLRPIAGIDIDGDGKVDTSIPTS